MTSETRPPRRAARKGQSHWSRNVWIAIIGVFVLLAAVGSAVNRQALLAEQTPPPDVAASGAIATEPADEVSPPVAPGGSLVAIEGSGPMTSDPFNASGESVDVTYEYTCSEDASFTLNFYGTYESPLLPDVLASEFGAGGSGTASESLGGTTGPFTVEVDTVCDWSVGVLGAP